MKYKYVIYGREDDMSSRQAARMLRDNQQDYRFIHIDDEEYFSTEDLKSLVIKTEAKKIPIVFIDDEYIGSKEELENDLDKRRR